MGAGHVEDHGVRHPHTQREEGGEEGEMKDQGGDSKEPGEKESQRSTSRPRHLSLVLKFIQNFFFSNCFLEGVRIYLMQSGRGKAPLNHPSTVNIDRGRGGQEATAPGGCSPHLSGNATKLRDTPLGLRIFCDLLKQLSFPP